MDKNYKSNVKESSAISQIIAHNYLKIKMVNSAQTGKEIDKKRLNVHRGTVQLAERSEVKFLYFCNVVMFFKVVYIYYISIH